LNVPVYFSSSTVSVAAVNPPYSRYSDFFLPPCLVPVHYKESFVDYRVGIDVPGKYKIVLSSDEKRFGGHERLDMNSEYFTTDMEWNGRRNYLQAYVPSRVVLVLGKVD
jgi:1,4-alpha-glucan branching enzyme